MTSIMCYIKVMYVIVIVTFTMAGSPSVNLTSDQISALNEVTGGTNSFALDLYYTLSEKNPNTNVFTSPLSLQVVMAMAYLGAGGNTAKQIATTLGIPSDKTKMLNGYNALVNILKNPVLSLATKMFLEKTFDVKSEFSSHSSQYMESDIEKINFRGDSKGAKDIINSWVEKKTNNKIRDLISDGDLNELTKLVLVNAIHFKADWDTPFSNHSTKPAPFYITEKDTVEVQMMNIEHDFNYLEHPTLDAKILELPYQGKDFSMFILLPNKITGLAEMENALRRVDLIAELKNLTSTKVKVSFPKFEMSQTIDLNDILVSLGCEDMFSEEKADFSGISDIPLVVSKVIQKAFVKVDEKGTEAAAATGMVFLMRCMIYPEIFEANHEFLFIIARKVPALVFNFIGKFSAK